MDVKDEWQLELDRLLGIFERESELSLRKINRRFEALNQPFNDEFRQHFVKLSTYRLESSFSKIQMERWMNGPGKSSDGVSNSGRECQHLHGSTSNGDDGITTSNGLMQREDFRSDIVKKEAVIEVPDSNDEDDDDDDNQLGRQVGAKSDASSSSTAVGHSGLRHISVLNGRYIQSNKSDLSSPSNSLTDYDADEGNAAAGDAVGTNETIDTSGQNIFGQSGRRAILVQNDKTTTKSKSNASTNNKRPDNSKTGQLNTENGEFKRQASSSSSGVSQSKHSAGKRFKCNHCSTKFGRRSELKRHQAVHANGKLIGVKADSNGLYHCTHCIRKFINVAVLSRHMKIHKNGQHLYYCTHCMRQFGQKAKKEQHESQCEGHHYECHLCKVFVTTHRLYMQRHIRTHSGAKPFQCMVCDKSFQQKGNLKSHSNSVHSRVNP